ncbi:hypothetical protein D8674_013031 [Pyrus ussuriensis x Pyrus communis]|uniref:TMV resistance protein N-like n=1 Tax=Pyrus ussuriensis x Pyrus communis TaxID=2448454 RepID=A0A5N5GU08_9ROSA|nr:hypothetical protein D8674_013031 [Pyrus ussuriensis x Pyrus communis]
MISTILDMGQVFGLRPSGRCVNITHEWSSPSYPVVESSKVFQSVTSLEYNPTTFKSYGTSFTGFIPFAKTMYHWFSDNLFQYSFGDDASNFCKEKFISSFNFKCTSLFTTWWEAKWSRKYNRDLRKTHDRIFRLVFFMSFPDSNLDEMDVGPEEEVVDALVLQEAATEAVKQEAGSSHVPEDTADIFAIFSEAPRWPKFTVMESFDSKLEVRPQARLNLPAPRATPPRRELAKKPDPSPQEMPASKEGQQSDKEVLAKILEELKAGTSQTENYSSLARLVHLSPSRAKPSEIPVVSKATTPKAGLDNSPQLAVSRVVLPRPSRVSGILRIPIPWPRKSDAAESSPFISIDAATTVAASDGAGVMLPPLASFLAIASLPKLVREFDLKALQDVEKALTDLYQSFISFFKNLKVLRDQHLKAKRQANRVKCYKEKHIKTSTTLQQQVEKGLAMKD